MSNMTELLIATHNAGKVRELRELLADLPVRLRGLDEFPEAGEAEETGQTFAENAILKARFYAQRCGVWALADDSGLEVDGLGGAPGVFSARYGGEWLTDAGRIEKLLGELKAAGERARRARFVCVIAVNDPVSSGLDTFTGTCEGRIAAAPRGSGGFGYDPIFIPDGFEQTFGELPAETKRLISHRARALQQASQFLRRQLQGIT